MPDVATFESAWKRAIHSLNNDRYVYRKRVGLCQRYERENLDEATNF